MTEMEKMMADLVKANQALTETITARFAPPDVKAREQEKDVLVDTVLKRLSDLGLRPPEPERKMVWGSKNGIREDGVKVAGFGQFIKAVLRNDIATLTKAATGQSEGTDADGGYAVPEEFNTTIIRLARKAGVVQSICGGFPMSSNIRNTPRGLLDPEIYVVGEATAPAHSKATLAPVVETAKRFMANVPFTKDLLEDDTAQFDAYVAERVALGISRRVDRYALVGNISTTGDSFDGVYFASGVNSVSLEGAALAYNDIVNVTTEGDADYRLRSVFMFNKTILRKVMKLTGENNQPIWTIPSSGNPGTLLGYPYYETDQIPDTLGTGRTNGSNTALIFGAFEGLWVSDRGVYRVEASNSASDSAGASAWMLDEIWTKFITRKAITVVNPEAFTKLAVPAA